EPLRHCMSPTGACTRGTARTRVRRREPHLRPFAGAATRPRCEMCSAERAVAERDVAGETELLGAGERVEEDSVHVTVAPFDVAGAGVAEAADGLHGQADGGDQLVGGDGLAAEGAGGMGVGVVETQV